VPVDQAADRPEVVPSADPGKLHEVSPKEMLVRFALGGSVSIVAGIIAKAVGARIGGVFLAFPAILPATLTIVQEKEGTRKADRNAIGAVLGAVALICFAAVGESQFGRLNSAVVLVLALLAWIGSSLLLYAALAVLRPDDCDQRRD
jgi:Protein of unknown function (DUF3147)